MIPKTLSLSKAGLLLAADVEMAATYLIKTSSLNHIVNTFTMMISNTQICPSLEIK